MRFSHVAWALLLVSCGTPDTERAPDRASRAPVSATKSEVAGGATLAARVAVLSTVPGATETTLRWQPVAVTAVAAPAATLSHLPDGEVRGALATTPGAAFVVAETEPGRDRSFASSLWLMRSAGDPLAVAKGVVYASRPLVLADGRVVVQRGVAGDEPDAQQAEAGHLRTDALSVDIYDAHGAHQKTLHQFAGYITHLAGAYGREVFLYRVRFQHADIVAVHADTGELRIVLPELTAMARDFSLDTESGHLVYANRDAAGWHVARLELVSGRVDVFARARDMRVMPAVWPGGGVLVNDGSGGTLLGGSGPDRALGAGFDELRATAGGWVALEHHVPSAFSVPFAFDLEAQRVHELALPSGARHSVVGVAP
jgi:hypothetical protein